MQNDEYLGDMKNEYEYLDQIEIDGYEDALNQNVDVDELQTATPYLCVVDLDASTSMDDYEYNGVMTDCLKNFKNAIVNSKQVDEMVTSKIIFGSKVNIGGFVKPENFDCSYTTRGATALYDSIIAGRKLILDYMDQITDRGGTPRGCFVILSDGVDNDSEMANLSMARDAIKELTKREVTVAFITFGSDAEGIASSLGVKPQNVKDFNNDEHGLREALNMVSKSAISASKRASAGQGVGDAGFFDV